MVTNDSTVDFILEQIGDARTEKRRMFGATALMRDGKMVALISKETLFLKPTEAGRALLGKPKETSPCKGLNPWYVIPGDRWDDGTFLSDLVIATAAALPPPKPKRPRRVRGPG
jgi:DNA transformation protein and related proteins